MTLTWTLVTGYRCKATVALPTPVAPDKPPYIPLVVVWLTIYYPRGLSEHPVEEVLQLQPMIVQ